MTDALATVLDGLGDAAVPWAVVGDLVRRRVRALQPEQRPEVEGPSERLPFSAASAAASDALAITTIRGVSTVEAGELLGLAVGDELDIVAAADGDRIGEATVKSSPAVRPSPGRGAAAAAIADGTAIAVPRNISVPKLFVHIGDVGQRRRRPAPRDRAQHAPRRHRAPRRSHRRCRAPAPPAGSVTLARRRRCAVARHSVRRRRGRTPRARRFPVPIKVAKPLIFLLCLVPFAALIWAIFFNPELGADPLALPATGHCASSSSRWQSLRYVESLDGIPRSGFAECWASSHSSMDSFTSFPMSG